MNPLALRIAYRYALKYTPKETKVHKVERLREIIRERTGLSRGQSESIADAYVRGRDVSGLALQKGLPIENGILEGPSGKISIKDFAAEL